MTHLDEVKNILRKNKADLKRRYPIKSLAIFGSVTRDDFNRFSDVDVMVEIDGNVGIRFIDLADELESLLNCNVDLVSKEGIKPGYLAEIEHDLVYV